MNEKETISLKCPIDLNKQQKFLTNNEYDQINTNNNAQIENNDSDDYENDAREKLDTKLENQQNNYPFINWYKNENVITKDELRYQTDGIYLKIKTISLNDAGKYKCLIKSQNGNSASSNIINLIVRPLENKKNSSPSSRRPNRRMEVTENGPAFLSIVKSQPKIFNRPLGSQVRFRCRASGSPRPNIIWYKNGELLREEDFSYFR